MAKVLENAMITHWGTRSDVPGLMETREGDTPSVEYCPALLFGQMTLSMKKQKLLKPILHKISLVGEFCAFSKQLHLLSF